MTFVSAPIAIGTADTLIYQCPATLEGSVHGLQFENYSGGAVVLTIKLFKQATGATSTVRTKSLAAGEEYQFTKINVAAGDRVLANAASNGTVRALANAYVDAATPVAVGFTPRGTWLVGSSYAVNDVVDYNGSSYIARAANVGSQPPSVNWMTMSEKGAQGPAGSGAGDMVTSTYDPTGKGSDAFNMENMTEGATKKILSATERTKLAGIANGATAYVHPTGDGNQHIPATGTLNNRKVLMAGSTAGSAAWDNVTKSDVSLGNVDNTSDANKPVSTLQAQAIALKAPLDSPAFSGTPTAPTPAQGTNTDQIATMAAVQAAIGALIDGAPGAIDTLNELAAAMGDDPNFAATVTNALAGKLASSAVSTFMLSLLDDADATTARATLGLIIGTNVQAFDANLAKVNAAQNFTATQRTAPVALSSASSLAFTLAGGNSRTLTLGTNATLPNPSDIATYVGMKGSIACAQDGTGSRTLSFGSLWFPIGAASAPAAPTAANAKFRIDYEVVSSTRIDFALSSVGVA